jgi:hypothetical protein
MLASPVGSASLVLPAHEAPVLRGFCFFDLPFSAGAKPIGPCHERR